MRAQEVFKNQETLKFLNSISNFDAYSIQSILRVSISTPSKLRAPILWPPMLGMM